MAIVVLMVNMKAVTPRIGVIVRQVKTWTCSWHSHCNVNDKCFCTDNSCRVIYLDQTSTHPMLHAFFNYLQSLSSPELDSIFCMTYKEKLMALMFDFCVAEMHSLCFQMVNFQSIQP